MHRFLVRKKCFHVYRSESFKPIMSLIYFQSTSLSNLESQKRPNKEQSSQSFKKIHLILNKSALFQPQTKTNTFEETGRGGA